jgi:hypothetical protein
MGNFVDSEISCLLVFQNGYTDVSGHYICIQGEGRNKKQTEATHKAPTPRKRRERQITVWNLILGISTTTIKRQKVFFTSHSVGQG